MVVGATGAIGSVCARLLAMVAEEVYMVSPETAKLLSLKGSILKETPDAKLFLSSRADKDIADMDMIVTATSGAGKKVLDIMKVKPGCVITDVARPLDLPPEEVAKRPDVLVIESGEIQLPGKVSMKNIGLPKNVAYACLAETIVLALEGRFENFTVGRNIEWEKVREIYRLGPQARHEARGHLRGQRAVLRCGHSPGAEAGACRAGEARVHQRGRRAPRNEPSPGSGSAGRDRKGRLTPVDAPAWINERISGTHPEATETHVIAASELHARAVRFAPATFSSRRCADCCT